MQTLQTPFGRDYKRGPKCVKQAKISHTHFKDRVVCQISMDYQNTKITQYALRKTKTKTTTKTTIKAMNKNTNSRFRITLLPHQRN